MNPLSNAEIEYRIVTAEGILQNLDCPFRAYLFGPAARLKMDETSDVGLYLIFDTEDDLNRSTPMLIGASSNLKFKIDWLLVSKTELERSPQKFANSENIVRAGILLCERLMVDRLQN